MRPSSEPPPLADMNGTRDGSTSTTEQIKPDCSDSDSVLSDAPSGLLTPDPNDEVPKDSSGRPTVSLITVNEHSSASSDISPEGLGQGVIESDPAIETEKAIIEIQQSPPAPTTSVRPTRKRVATTKVSDPNDHPATDLHKTGPSASKAKGESLAEPMKKPKGSTPLWHPKTLLEAPKSKLVGVDLHVSLSTHRKHPEPLNS